MTWEASDIALVITTATTALTAVSSVIMPFLTRAKDEKDRQKNAKYERISSSVLFVVANVDQVVDITRKRNLSSTLRNAQKFGITLSDEELKLECDFQSHLRMSNLLAREIGVEKADLSVWVSIARLNCPAYRIDGSEAVPTSDVTEKIRQQREALDNLVESAERILRQARETLKIE
ncbi:hypothetical protein [Roseivivax sp. CAU 1761]